MDELATFKQAVHTLYHANTEHERKEADRWLEQWQSQTSAWQVADSILHDASRPEEELYFAAQTLRTKVCSLLCFTWLRLPSRQR